jgi:hypothetical protein
MFTVYGTSAAQVYGVIFLTVNRFTAVAFPLVHRTVCVKNLCVCRNVCIKCQKLWRSKQVLFCICLQWGLTLVWAILFLTPAYRAHFDGNLPASSFDDDVRHLKLIEIHTTF